MGNNFGFFAPCEFPLTGENCTVLVVDQLTPAIDIYTTIGMVEFGLLLPPTLLVLYKTLIEFRMGREKSLFSGKGLRFMCAVASTFAGIATFGFHMTGGNQRYPVTEALGAASFICIFISICGYHFATCCVILLARLIFFGTLKMTKAGPKLEALQKVKEWKLLFVFIAPTALGYLIPLILLQQGLMADNMYMQRAAMGGCSLSALVLLFLNKLYAWPAVVLVQEAAKGTTGNDA
jgi:hypothetical protein